MCLKQQCTGYGLACIQERRIEGVNERKRGGGGETCREKDETRKDDDDERSMKKKSRRAMHEETGVVTLDCINKNSSPHLKTAGLFKDHLKCWWWCVWYYTSRQLTSFSPLPHPRTVRNLRATMTQAALRIHLNTHKRRVYRHAYGYKESLPIHVYIYIYIYIYPICFLYLVFGPYPCRFNKKESETIILDFNVCCSVHFRI
jgi:hypothetical protein